MNNWKIYMWIKKITQTFHLGQAHLPLIPTYTLKTNKALNICLELSYASFPNHTLFLNIYHEYLEWRMFMYIYIYILLFLSPTKIPDIILCIIYPLGNSYQLMMHDSDKEM
jgi:hypothetical protein